MGSIVYFSSYTGAITIDPPTGRPIVLVNCYPARGMRPAPAILPDDFGGAQAATEHLLAAGHRRIAFINGEPWFESAAARLAGYRAALSAAGIAPDRQLIRQGNWLQSSGYDQTDALLTLARPPEPIFCASDLMAAGCYEALKGHGVSIPDDMSVVGFDDRELARHLHPTLTTVVLPFAEMARLAVARPLRQAEAALPTCQRVSCQMVQRESVAPTSSA